MSTRLMVRWRGIQKRINITVLNLPQQIYPVAPLRALRYQYFHTSKRQFSDFPSLERDGHRPEQLEAKQPLSTTPTEPGEDGASIDGTSELSPSESNQETTASVIDTPEGVSGTLQMQEDGQTQQKIGKNQQKRGKHQQKRGKHIDRKRLETKINPSELEKVKLIHLRKIIDGCYEFLGLQDAAEDGDPVPILGAKRTKADQEFKKTQPTRTDLLLALSEFQDILNNYLTRQIPPPSSLNALPIDLAASETTGFNAERVLSFLLLERKHHAHRPIINKLILRGGYPFAKGSTPGSPDIFTLARTPSIADIARTLLWLGPPIDENKSLPFEPHYKETYPGREMLLNLWQRYFNPRTDKINRDIDTLIKLACHLISIPALNLSLPYHLKTPQWEIHPEAATSSIVKLLHDHRNEEPDSFRNLILEAKKPQDEFDTSSLKYHHKVQSLYDTLMQRLQLDAPLVDGQITEGEEKALEGKSLELGGDSTLSTNHSATTYGDSAKLADISVENTEIKESDTQGRQEQ